MADTPKRFVIGSMIVAALVALVAVLDLTIGIPFSGTHTTTMDIIFLISSGILGYLCWDAYKDLQ
jgi:hypothetical protein